MVVGVAEAGAEVGGALAEAGRPAASLHRVTDATPMKNMLLPLPVYTHACVIKLMPAWSIYQNLFAGYPKLIVNKDCKVVGCILRCNF